MVKELVQGNEAIARGALDAGMGFYAGYPITPASEIMHYLADKDIKFIQAEDEIASANLCIGASIAGEKTMTATSGPGFSLMQESIGFAHATRTPLVIVNCQRVGPSTGMPTMPSQGDVLQSRYGTHGDIYPIVFAPNSINELYEYTVHAFNAAEQSKTPVILLSDSILSQMYESVEFEKLQNGSEIKSLASSASELGSERKGANFGSTKKHITGLLSKENTPVTKDFGYYVKWFENYKKEVEAAAKSYEFFEYLENKNADTLLIAFGCVSRVLLDLKKDYSIFRPIRMFPVLPQIKEIAEKHKKVIVVEMNDGQYASELRKILGDKIESVSILGGKISLQEIKNKLEGGRRSAYTQGAQEPLRGPKLRSNGAK